ncbi:hypothetical protein DL546_004268 [Coniochaeta pulveracea]|uniref:Isopropylmalate dehydrogenase-like domain-containing protein n=1 Tax=Coniochaeta pulveracea TaxID=177199 RepID=A0A420Y415_9PEZI|nr:hypothetical protein DL546_004268 [Coniochaeta pulveracea]
MVLRLGILKGYGIGTKIIPATQRLLEATGIALQPLHSTAALYLIHTVQRLKPVKHTIKAPPSSPNCGVASPAPSPTARKSPTLPQQRGPSRAGPVREHAAHQGLPRRPRPPRVDGYRCDIFSDLAAGLGDSLGLAPGASIGDNSATFEASHGDCPGYCWKGSPTPLALVLSGAELLDLTGNMKQAKAARDAIRTVVENKRDLTPDLGGSGSTESLTQVVVADVRRIFVLMGRTYSDFS